MLRRYISAPVIMVSVQPESQYATRCLLAGATAYINRTALQKISRRAIRKIIDSGAKVIRIPI